MSRNKRIDKYIGLLLWFMALIGLNGCTEPVNNSSADYRILVIHSYSVDYSWVNDLNQGITDCFQKSKLKTSVETFYLDIDGMNEQQWSEAISAYLDKVSTPDLILVCDDQATNALLATKHRLTYSVPVVFSGVDYLYTDLLKGHSNVTGFTTTPDYRKWYDLFTHLFPNNRQTIININNSRTGQLALSEYERQMNAIDSTITKGVFNMDTMSVKWLLWGPAFIKWRIQLLPVWDSFFSVCLQNSLMPTFAVNSEGFNSGAIGGYITPSYNQTYMAANLGLRLLNGESVDLFPITPSPQILMFNWGKMQRFHLTVKQLPADAVIVGMPFGVRYKAVLLIACVMAILLLGTLVLILIYMYRTERRLKQHSLQSLQEHRDKLKIVMSSIREGVISFDREMNIFSINQAALYWLNLEGEEADYLGRDITSLISISYSGKKRYLRRMIASVFDEERTMTFDYGSQMLSLDNNHSFLVVGELCGIYQDQQSLGAVLTFHDITEEFTQREFLSLVMGAGNISSWRYDVQTRSVIIDPSFFVLYNVKDDGTHCIPLAVLREMIHPEDVDNWEAVYSSMLNSVEGKQILQMRVDFNGNGYRWWEFRYIKSMASSVGEMPFALGLCINIQKFKQTQEALTQAREKAEQSEQLKSAFLANMSHEIRTPLNAIVGFSNILTSEDDFSFEERRLFIETIQHNCNMLLDLISDILDLAQIDSGTMAFKEEYCDVNQLIHQIVVSQQVIIPEQLQLIEQVPVEGVQIRTDKLRLNQVLINLINNAVKFTPQGSVTIGYTVETDGFLHFFIEDTGKGISEDDLNNVFMRFFKKDDFASGAGLGLSICRMIVDRFGGTISVTSKVGVGTRFTVRIPYIQENELAGESSSHNNNKLIQKQNMNTENLSGATPGNRVNILIAEDEDSNYLLLKTILQKHCNLYWAKTGKEVLRIYGEQPVDLILMDIKMPEMTGIEALKLIREQSTDIPVIMQSAYVFDSDMEAANQAGASDFITKPINMKILKSTISRYCPSIVW
ncbi:MAG: response regulator [Tannerellaceae bacterium]